MTSEREQLVSIRDAARHCGKNPETVRRWVWSGRLAAEKLGNQLFIRKSDLASFCREAASATSPDIDAPIAGFQPEPKEEHGTEPSPGSPAQSTKPEPGSKEDIIKRMRELRAEVKARVGNFEAREIMAQLREERPNELTSMR